MRHTAADQENANEHDFLQFHRNLPLIWNCRIFLDEVRMGTTHWEHIGLRRQSRSPVEGRYGSLVRYTQLNAWHCRVGVAEPPAATDRRPGVDYRTDPAPRASWAPK